MHYRTFHKALFACFTLCTTSIGAAALPISGQIESVTGSEHLSRPYRFEVELVGQAPDTSLADLIGAPASFTLPGGRMVAGVVDEIRSLGAANGGLRFRLVIVPELHDLAYTHRTRTFNERDSVEIISSMLAEMGMDADFPLQGDYRTHINSTQYAESDLDYIHRLLEAEGIYYYFEHSANGSQLIMSDDSTSADLLNPTLQMSGPQANVIAFDYGFAKHPGTIRLHGSNYKTPNVPLTTNSSVSRYTELVDEHYGARHTVPAYGAADANTRLQGTLAHALQVRGQSRLSALVPGSLVRLDGHVQAEANQSYFITSVEHQVAADGSYRNSFTAIPASLPFRSLYETLKPEATPTFAYVVGPAGSEIHTDEYGRVKVALPWTVGDHSSAPWIRVLQPNADSLWLPRIGEEVLVAFEYGDPDRPYVAGAVFNGTTPPILALPDNKHKRTLAARSTLGGPRFHQSMNSLTFDDQSGEEVVEINAVRNFVTITGNNQTLNVGQDQEVNVGENQVTKVEDNQLLTVGGNQNTRIVGDSLTTAKRLVIQGEESIVLRVGRQDLIIDSKGVRWPGMPTETPKVPDRTAPTKTPQSTSPIKPTTQRTLPTQKQ